MKIGITGHQRLEHSSDWAWVEANMRKEINKYGEHLVGISSLAIGADQLFARIILHRNLNLYVVLPFEGYEDTFESEQERSDYFSILHKASNVETLLMQSNREESYLEAGKRIVNLSDILFAVWDGEKAAGLGGTGDIVEYAKKAGKRIIHFNPANKVVV